MPRAEDETYEIDLCYAVLRLKSLRGHGSPFLRGDEGKSISDFSMDHLFNRHFYFIVGARSHKERDDNDRNWRDVPRRKKHI
jgi:hypothetical protein